MKRGSFKPKLYWCIHHQVLLEVNTEPIKNRIRYIKKGKDKHERPLRLLALKPVKRVDLLPRSVRKYAKAAIRDILSGRYDWHYRRLLNDAVHKNMKRCAMRHKKECPRVPFIYTTKDAWQSLGLDFAAFNSR